MLSSTEQAGISRLVHELALRLEQRGYSNAVILDETVEILARIQTRFFASAHARQAARPLTIDVSNRALAPRLAHASDGGTQTSWTLDATSSLVLSFHGQGATREGAPPHASRSASLQTAELAIHPPIKTSQTGAPGPKPACARSLSNEFWLQVFTLLPLSALILASHVCRSWRTIILSTPRLWSVLVGVSTTALGGLAEFLSRSQSCPVELDLNVDASRISDLCTLFDTIATHMQHINSLSLSLSFIEGHHSTLHRLLYSEAPLLRRFQLWSTSFLHIPKTLFSEHSPQLTDVCLPVDSLPAECPALRRVTSFVSCDGQTNLSADAAAKLFSCCPMLEHLQLSAPLRDDMERMKKGMPYFINTVAPKPLKSLLIPEHVASTLAFTLRTLEHDDIKRITIPGVSIETFRFIRKRFDRSPIEHVTFARTSTDSHIVLVDADGRERIFPRAAPAALDALLFTCGVFNALTSLAIPDALFCKHATLPFVFPCLASLTVLVALVPHYPGSTDIFDATGPQPILTCRVLRTLRLSSSNPVGMPSPSPRRVVPRPSTQDVATFIRAALGFTSIVKLPRVVLDGVLLKADRQAAELLLTLVREVDVVSH